MAKARMLHKTISTSQDVNKLSLPSKLLVTWMIAHADDEGKLRGESNYIKAIIVPMLNWSSRKIDKYLNEIESAGLIYRWEHNNEWFIEFVQWNEHQTIRKDRFIPSKLPSYTNKSGENKSTNEQPTDNQKTAQLNVIEGNKNESNLTTEGFKKTSEESSYRGLEKLRKTVKEFGLNKKKN